MANLIPQSIDFYIDFDAPYNYKDKETAAAKLKQYFGESYLAREGEEVRLYSKVDETTVWLDRESLMIVVWLSGKKDEDTAHYQKAKQHLAEYVSDPEIPKAFTRVRVSMPGYYFPDNADTKEASEAAVRSLLKNIINPKRFVRLLDYNVEISQKTPTGKKSISYAAAYNKEEDIYALGIELNHISSFAPGITSTEMLNHINGIDIMKEFQDEQEQLKKFNS